MATEWAQELDRLELESERLARAGTAFEAIPKVEDEPEEGGADWREEKEEQVDSLDQLKKLLHTQRIDEWSNRILCFSVRDVKGEIVRFLLSLTSLAY
jgi:hypothetical protein